jgi:hypothetical protein
MKNIQEVPGEDEGLQRYFSLPIEGRKLVVDVCAELYQMNREEQLMLLGIARTYRKNKPVVDVIPAKPPGRPSYLRLVA